MFFISFCSFSEFLGFLIFYFYGECSFISLRFLKYPYFKIIFRLLYYFNLVLSKSIFQLVIWLASFLVLFFATCFAVLVCRLILKGRSIPSLLSGHTYPCPVISWLHPTSFLGTHFPQLCSTRASTHAVAD